MKEMSLNYHFCSQVFLLITRWIEMKNKSYEITFVSNIGAASTNDSPHTPKSDFLELLIVQMDRAFMGITITMNLSNKGNTVYVRQ